MIRLLWRQFNQERWPALLMALTVALLAAVAGLIPRLMSDLDDRQLSQEVGALSAIRGDISGSWTDDPAVVQPGQDVWPTHIDAANQIRESQPAPLRPLLKEPDFLGSISPDVVFTPPPDSGYYKATFTLFIDPALADNAELVDGAWPTMSADGYQVAVLDEVAEQMDWSVGDNPVANAVITGIFTPNDKEARRWEHITYGATYGELNNPDRGLEMRAGMFLPPDFTAETQTVIQPSDEELLGWDSIITRRVWFSVDTAAIRAGGVDVATLSAQLTSLLAKRHPVSYTPDGEPLQEIRLNSELNTTLERVLAQQATTRSVLAVSAVGPLAVGLALVLLATRLVVVRREQWLTVLHARGLDRSQTQRLALAEAALLAVPAAFLGFLAPWFLVDGPRPWWSWLIPAVVAAVACVALVMGVAGAGATRGRADLGVRGGRWRLVGEVLAVLAAVAATWQLLTRPDDEARLGLDVLGISTPVLWTLAASLLLLRLYPLPLQLISARLKRSRGLTGFLGAVRSLRDPAGGIVPILTVLLGTTLAVMGATLVSTLVTGTEEATWTSNGAQIRLTGPQVRDELLEQIRGVDGVAEVARIYSASDNAEMTQGDVEQRPRVLLVDPEIMDVYASLPGGSPVPGQVFGSNDVVVSPDISITQGSATIQGLGDVNVVGQLEALPGSPYGDNWVVADVNAWQGQVSPASVALISVQPGADVKTVTEQLAEAVPNALITDVESQLEVLRDSPTIDGLTRAFVVLTAATAVLMVLGVVGSMLLNSGGRAHLGAVLRTLGLKPGQLRALTAWEIGPAIIVALIAGGLLGVGLAALMLAGMDFRVLTGGAQVPSLSVNWPTLLAVLGALVATMGVTVAAMSWLAGRTNVAQELRIGDQR